VTSFCIPIWSRLRCASRRWGPFASLWECGGHVCGGLTYLSAEMSIGAGFGYFALLAGGPVSMDLALFMTFRVLMLPVRRAEPFGCLVFCWACRVPFSAEIANGF